MSHQEAVELPAPSGSFKSDDGHEEDDPFSDRHHISPEEDLDSAESLHESSYASHSQPAELPALVEQRVTLLASLKGKSPASRPVQSDSKATPPISNPAPPAEPPEEPRSREQQHDSMDRARSAAAPAASFTDPRPVRERIPPEFYSLPLVPRTGHGLPLATDVQGRYILKKAISRAALQLAGIAYTEGDDHVLLHIDPGPIALRDLRVASVAMQHPADWWRLEAPDDPAYPHPRREPAGAMDAPPPERRDARFKNLIAPWKRRPRNAQAGPSSSRVAGSSSAAAARRQPTWDDSDSEDDMPVKHLYR